MLTLQNSKAVKYWKEQVVGCETMYNSQSYLVYTLLRNIVLFITQVKGVEHGDLIT